MSVKEKSKLMDVVTIEEINRLSCSQQQLLIMRLLMGTDGLVSGYQALKEETVKDICDCADAILQIDCGDPEFPGDCSGLNAEEQSEYLFLVETMRVYGGF